MKKLFFILLLSTTHALAEKPNVLFIAVDDLRPELASFGSHQAKSPNIDKLGTTGVVFNRAYCNIPVCGASRSSLMSGIYPTTKRFTTYTSRVDEDTPGAKTLPQQFKQAGYSTVSIGKIFHNPSDSAKQSWTKPPIRPKIPGTKFLDKESGRKLSKRKRGRIFESPAVEDNAYPDGMIAEETIKHLRELKKRGQPFFLACGFVKPHLPFYAPKKYWDLYDRSKIKIADNQYTPKGAPPALRGSSEFRAYWDGDMAINSEQWHRMMVHGYLACISYVDKLVGDILHELDTLNLTDNTIVVFWGDHGFHLGEHNFWGKHNTMHWSTRVPLVVKAPGKKTGESNTFIETVDIFPTLCELAQLEKPAQLQGKSFVATLADPSKPHRNYIYSRFKTGDVVVTKGHALTRYSNGDLMLFDHKKDPEENQNVAKNPKYKHIIKDLSEKLDENIRKAESARWK